MSNISKERIQNAARAIEDYFCASDRAYGEHTKAAQAALKADAEHCGDGWQDISTAPKDGTVLLLADGEMVLRGSFKEDYLSGETGWFDEHWDDYSTGSTFTPLKPTHWQPLPPAPQQEESE